VLLFCSGPDTTRDMINKLINLIVEGINIFKGVTYSFPNQSEGSFESAVARNAGTLTSFRWVVIFVPDERRSNYNDSLTVSSSAY
jgi:hypothetical protein